ncbi:hypothetical protein [Tolypothrix sp. PCC 7601]|uniref:hypothetical protein n=1 Tax=Tolypothrix sp. PCC 7601 TaxID=1188 RepID=UPI0005EABE02|nr:hypothetical protein [Tolypothrix sp. PCC 7601]EKE98963.1 hypothetical protein FDUTEX481_03151 [Tolypothrix sp. PCC 7601]UYD35646.1 hypothetical protein HG267_07750 [Tolypothrix sp. PCC 7601]BAY94790.1 hypothetical protein NIES3275_68440 [Microchaete diplosiphon NIES-3275]
MTDVGIAPVISFSSYSGGMSKSIDNSFTFYSYIPPIQVGSISSLSHFSRGALVAFQVIPSFNFYSYSAGISSVIFGGLTLPFAPIPVGFNQSVSYQSVDGIAPINLIDVLGLPTIQYFVGFNEWLEYESNYSESASQAFNLRYLSSKPAGLIDNLAELLGFNYSQDINEIRIKISDLSLSDASKAQNILVAIIFNALGAFIFSKTMKAELWGIKIINDTKYAAIVVTKTELE